MGTDQLKACTGEGRAGFPGMHNNMSGQGMSSGQTAPTGGRRVQ